MDEDFVRAHGKFGKTRPTCGKGYTELLRRGSRRGDTLIRSYPKKETRSYRVEVELHSRLLRRWGLRKTDDLWRLASLLYPNRICFVRIDWNRLAAYLGRRGSDEKAILKKARGLSSDLHEVLTYLRHEVGVKNVHRFLVPMPENKQVERALKKWAARWNRV